MSGRWAVALAAAGTAALLVVPTWLRAAPAGAPVLQTAGPPARTLPTDVLVPWVTYTDDVAIPPPGLGASVWCDGALGCRAFNADDHAITAWARTALIDPFVAGTPTPTVVPLPATATPLPAVLTPVCTASATVTGLTALVTAQCDRATTAVVDVAVYPLPPIHIVADAQRHNREVQLGPDPVALSFQFDALTVPGEYVVKLGVFSWSWGEVYGWNDDAARLSVAVPGTPTATVTATVPAPPTGTAVAPTVTPTPVPVVPTATASPAPTAAPTATAVAPGPLATVVCLSAQFADGVLTCAPKE